MLAPLLLAAAFAAPPDFERDVKPLLTRRCVACHGPALQKSHLRVDQRASLLKGGESGVAGIVAGDSGRSLLIRYVADASSKIVMPPAGPRLSAAEVDLLRAWIDSGAVMPGAVDAAEKPDPRLAHWAFQKLPALRRGSIDGFINARLASRKWKPAPRASNDDLLRRLYLDVIGLPPTIEEQDRFDGNFASEIDRLLARPEYGERWARHWLDVVRYADTNAYERDAVKPEVWKYRDWVIRSLNADKPYDRFLTEQLAGDELPDANAETMIATGYYRLGPWDDEPADPAEDRFDQLDDMISTTSQAVLGLTLGCARCHNHKFEPLTTRDYYSMAAVFNGLQRPRNGRTEVTRPIGTRAEVAHYAAHREAWLKGSASKLGADVRAAFLIDAKDRTEEQKKLVRENEKALESELAISQGYFMEERGAMPPAMHIMIRGKASAPGPEVGPDVPAILRLPQLVPVAGETSGRRLALARAMTSRDNPLTARVIVNRVWQWHFGEGLVRTASDFGVMGDKPSHPELLDWLAVWFMDNGWSLKKLHKLILMSDVYQRSSQSIAAYAAEDPDNRLLWRFPYRRMEAEPLLDSMLAVSGKLNREMYGPHVYPHVAKEALEGSSDPDKIWKPYEEEKASRRAIYYIVKRSLMVPLMEVLDLCDTARTAAKRQNTAVATQALQLFNGDFVNRQARHFAARLRAEAGDDIDARIERAYRLALARRPSAAEKAAMRAFLQRSSLEEMARVIFNLNEFAYAN
ncbi:MAG: DUF1553 domain-containing protein [Acidobacteria bacterium]|nr:DUF1553 domain-containing protein [Acidobacteriota bacterium]